MGSIRLALAIAALVLAGCGASSAGLSDPSRPSDLLVIEATAPTKIDQPIAVHARTGRSRVLPFTDGCGDAQFCLVASAGKLVIGEVGRTYVYDPAAPGRPRKRRIGSGWIIVPSMTAGRVWVGPLDCRTHAACRHWPIAALRSGLLFQATHSLRLWSLRTRSWAGRVPGPFPAATYGNVVASCDEPCPRLAISDAITGETTRVRAPHGYWFSAYNDGAFSPDGSLLAVPVGYHPDPDRLHFRRYAVALVDLEDRTATIVPGSLDAIYHTIAWSPTGNWLYFGAPRGRIRGYRLGSNRSTLIARPTRARRAGSSTWRRFERCGWSGFSPRLLTERQQHPPHRLRRVVGALWLNITCNSSPSSARTRARPAISSTSSGG